MVCSTSAARCCRSRSRRRRRRPSRPPRRRARTRAPRASSGPGSSRPGRSDLSISSRVSRVSNIFSPCRMPMLAHLGVAVPEHDATTARASVSTVQAGAFLTKRSPGAAWRKACSTRSTDSWSDIRKRVIVGSVTVSGLPSLELADEQRDDRAARVHDVAVAGDRDRRRRVGVVAGERLGRLLHERLGHAHGVDGVDGLVGAEADDRADAGAVRGLDDVVAADDVGLHGLVGEELARRHLLERRGVEDEVGADDGVCDAVVVTDVADEELAPASRRGAGASRPAWPRRG